MLETIYYPEGKTARAPSGNANKEYLDFLHMAACEGVSATDPQSSPAECPPALPFELLEHAGRVAWRNATRCIGRLYWRSLVVRDLRHVNLADDVFEACVEHLKIATNGGRIKPVLSIFAPADQNKQGPKILNHQLIRYAGYDIGDGKILGDPQNAWFTRIALHSGWNPPKNPSAFDILPLAIQMPNQSIRWYEIPRDVIVEVRIRHPKYKWFEQLGLKWHAVPIITDMCFAAAGARYTCAPFSGWYMGTEISARNLSDENRYNMLPAIASKMGLEMNRRNHLWKDRSLIELNEAVLYSFEKDGITMIDHHNASNQFIRFAKQENHCGRNVKGDWSWLVPPISGSTSPLFHKSWDTRAELPNFFYQDQETISC